MNMKKSSTFFIMLLLALSAHAQIDNGSLMVDSIIRTLPEVMVKGQRPIVKTDGTKLIYNISKLIENKGIDNAYDAIRLLPAVNDHNGVLSLSGKSVTVMLNGKKLTIDADQLNTLLKSIPADQIKSTEVIYTAPAKYLVRGAVINILLNHAHNNIQGNIITSYNQSHYAKFNDQIVLNYNKGKFSANLIYKFDKGKRFSKEREEAIHQLSDGNIYNINTKSSLLSKYTENSIRFGIDYNWSDYHYLSFAYNGSFKRLNGENNISGNIESKIFNKTESTLHNFSLSYALPCGLSLATEYTYYNLPSSQLLNSTLPNRILNFSSEERQKINRVEFDVVKNNQLSEALSLNFGAYYTLSRDHSNQYYSSTGNNTENFPVNDSFLANEDIVNIFVGTDYNISKMFTINLSLAAEYYHNPSWNKWCMYPSVIMTYAHKSPHFVQLGFSSQSVFPNYWEVKNFTDYTNGGYDLIVGNPALKPSREYNINLLYLFRKKYNLNVWYNYVDDYFKQIPYQMPDELKVIYKSLNFNYQQQLGFQLSAPLNIGTKYSSNFDIMIAWQKEKCTQFYDIPFNRNKLWARFNLRNTFIVIPNKLFVNLNGVIRTKAIQAIYDLPASGSVDANVVYQFWQKKCMLKIYCNDIFETSSINPEIHYRNQKLKMDFTAFRNWGITFSYKFGSFTHKDYDEVDTSRFKK